MNQCVPSWNFKETPLSVRHHGSKSNSSTDVPIWDYGVEELTWNTGHSLGLLHVAEKQATNKYTLEKPSIERGTLASIVDQATTCLHQNPTLDNCGGNKVGPKVVVPTLVTTTNALVPSQTSNSITKHAQVPSLSTHCSTRVESCSGVPDTDTNTYVNTMTHTGIDTGLDHSVSNSATWGRDSYQVTFDTSEKELGTTGFTSPSMGSPENNSPALKKWKKISNKHDLGSPVEISDEEEKKKGKYSSSNKRGRAAAVHNQSERKRRDKINQRMKTLQKMIPNSNKTDKASMLDEVIEYLKQLQTEIQMMRGITNMGSMMLPMGMQQQLQMSMMSPMGMGMGIGMGMPGMTMAGMGGIDMNMLAGRSNLSGMSPVFHPGLYMQMSSWNGTADRLPTPVSTIHDSLSSFFACQSQPMTMDAYSRMASLYQQFQQQSDPNSKN